MPLLLFIAWLVPFDLPLSQLLHYAIADKLGKFYLLFLPTVVLATCVVRCNTKKSSRKMSLALFAWSLSGLCGLFGALLASKISVIYSVQDWFLGYFAPAVAVAGISVHPQRQAICSALLRGWEAYLLFGTFALGFAIWQSISLSNGWWDLPLLLKWTMWRYELMSPGNWYGFWFGNANKATNLFILMLLVTPIILSIDGTSPSRWRMRRLALLTSIHVLAMCSRLGLLILPIALLAGGYLRPFSTRMVASISALVLAVVVVNPSVPTNVFTTIFRGSQEDASGWLSTYSSEGGRFEQWAEVWQTWRPSLSEFFLGSGSGYYGIQTFGTIEAETHNFFIDRTLAAGVLGLLAVLAALLFAWTDTKRLERRKKFLVRVSLVLFVFMCLREFAPSYLFRTSLPGLVVAIVISLPRIAAPRLLEVRKASR